MVIWNRLKYVLSPQFDIYGEISKIVRGNVADIGFGTGFGTHLLTVHADSVVGYETDPDAIRFAEKVFPLRNLAFRHGNIASQNIVPGFEFDFVVMVDVIEHIKHDKRALENVRNLLAPHGTLILSTPNRLSRYRKSQEHVREYAPKELRALCGHVFPNVEICDHLLEPLSSQYQNPLLAVCRTGT